MRSPDARRGGRRLWKQTRTHPPKPRSKSSRGSEQSCYLVPDSSLSVRRRVSLEVSPEGTVQRRPGAPSRLTHLPLPFRISVTSGKNTGVGCSAFLQGIFLTQGSNLCFLCLLCWQQILYHKRHYPVTYRTFKCPQRPFYCLPFIRYTCFPPFFVTLFILISISVISPFHRCCLNAVIQYVTFGFFHSE